MFLKSLTNLIVCSKHIATFLINQNSLIYTKLLMCCFVEGAL